MQINEQKNKLIAALETEKNRMLNFGNDIHDHCITIEYLQTGKHNLSEDEINDMDINFPLLYAAITDYDTLLSDYTT